MDKGISVYFGYLSNPVERFQKIKDAGFTTIITSADQKWDWQNGELKQQLKLVKQFGLKLSSLHSSYNSKELKYFFEKGHIGDKQEKTLIKEVKMCKKYGFTSLVVHLKGTPSLLGLTRLRRILKVCNKTKIPLAIENLDYPELFDYVFKHINDPYLCFCYDAGHNHAYDPERDYLSEYGDKLVALHLHDNDGTEDQHTLNQYGTTDWKKIAKSLAKCPSVPLDYELLMHKHRGKITEELALSMCYKNACDLERLINKEINKSKKLK